MQKTILLGLMMVVVCFLLGTECRAQTVATIVGTVTDQSGAVVPSARVDLVNQATQFKLAVKTNSKGQYVASSIPTGPYEITVEKTGFETLRRSGILLHLATTLSVDLQLRVGSEIQKVSVHASAPLLQSQTATVSSLVNSRQMVALPLVSRDFTDLVLLSPGAHSGSAGNLSQNGSAYSINGSTDYSVNGSFAAYNSYFVDGIEDRSLWLNTMVIAPIVDSIKEYRVKTSNYSALYGGSAGAVTVVETKSGTNRFHGDAWEFLRNDALDANTFFNNRAGISRPPFRQNEFGGTFGGPIIHNKTFFFGDYQGIRTTEPQTSTLTIPTIAQRTMVESGDFSGLGTTIYNPYSVSTNAQGQSVRAAFPGNIIPTSMLDKPAVNLMKLLPKPTSSAAVNNFTFNPEGTQRTDQFDIRVDQNLSSSSRLFFKYSYYNEDQLSPGGIPVPQNSLGVLAQPLGASTLTIPLVNQIGTIGYTKTISPTTVNQAHFGIIRWNLHVEPFDETNDAATIGIPGVKISEYSGGLPNFGVAGISSLGDTLTYPEDDAFVTLQLDDTLTKIIGSHTLSLGFIYLHNTFNGYSAFPDRGSFNFNGQFTRQIGTSSSATALADFALGIPDSASRAELTAPFAMRFWSLAPFVNDSWRVTNRLTWQFGLRYSLQMPPLDAHNHWANFDVATGKLLLAGINGNSRRLINPDLDNFAPSMGLAYSLNHKTVLRAGAGMSYEYALNGGNQLYKNSPYFLQQVISTDENGIPPLTLSQGLPLPVAPPLNNEAALSSGSFTGFAPNFQVPRILQWSFGIERQLKPSMMLDVSYVGTRGIDLMTNGYDYNQAPPGPGAPDPRRPLYSLNPNVTSINWHDNCCGSDYNSLQVSVNKRFSHGLQFGASYTYASFLTNAPNINGGGVTIQNARCFSCAWGPALSDYTNVLTFNHVYELPFGPDRRFLSHGIGADILGNWNLNGIWTFDSGPKFTPTLSTNVSNATFNINEHQRPNAIANGNLPGGQRSINHWFNTSAFVAPAQYTFGNAGTGILTGPGYFDADLALIRHFRINERFGLNYRLEMFNAFNRANFNNPNSDIGTPLAGVISSTEPARIIQMALKLTF